MAAANPVLLDIPVDEWTPVAINVLSGVVHIIKADAIYYQTYRLTGDPAPSNSFVPGDDDFEGVPIYNRVDRVAGESILVGGGLLGAISGIDVYVWAKNAAGKIRVDIGA